MHSTLSRTLQQTHLGQLTAPVVDQEINISEGSLTNLAPFSLYHPSSDSIMKVVLFSVASVCGCVCSSAR